MRCTLACVLLLAGAMGGLAACGSSGASKADGRDAPSDSNGTPGDILAPGGDTGGGDTGGGNHTGGGDTGGGDTGAGEPSGGDSGGEPGEGTDGGDAGTGSGAGGTDGDTSGGDAGEDPGAGGEGGDTGAGPGAGGADGDTGGGDTGGDPGAGGTDGDTGGGDTGEDPGAGGSGGEPGAGGGGGEPSPRFLAEFHVAPEGNDANPGTPDRPWKTLAHAAKTLEPGEAAIVHAGTYPAVRLDARDGTPEFPITLVAAPGERPAIRGGTVEFRRAHWVVEGFDISPATTAFAVRFTGAGSKGNVLRNNLVHDGGAGAGVSIDGGATDVLVEGNEIWNFSRGGDSDSHGVVVQPNTARVRILRNHIHHNNGDSVQCLGPETTSAGGDPARDVLIEGNYLHEDRENAVDIKTCHDVVIRNNRAHSYFDTATSNGEGIVVHYVATGVTVEGNDISDVNRGIVVGKQASNVLVRRNVFHDGNGERVGIYFYEGRSMQALHNTLVNLATGVKVGSATGITVSNNLFSNCGQGVSGSGTVDRNLFHRAPATGTGAVEGDPLLDADYVPRDGSPALDAAKVLPGEPAGCGAGPDLGAKERC